MQAAQRPALFKRDHMELGQLVNVLNVVLLVAVTAVAAYGLFSIVGGLLCAFWLGRARAAEAL